MVGTAGGQAHVEGQGTRVALGGQGPEHGHFSWGKHPAAFPAGKSEVSHVALGEDGRLLPMTPLPYTLQKQDQRSHTPPPMLSAKPSQVPGLPSGLPGACRQVRACRRPRHPALPVLTPSLLPRASWEVK